ATDLENDQLTFAIRDGSDFASAAKNVTITIDQGTHKATITPIPGFVGTVDLLVGVRDQTDRSGVGLDDASNFNTEHFTLTVASDISLDSASDTGIYSDDNFTGNGTPSFTIHAAAGRTVTVTVNGAGA